jgi:zinc/manganese transport system substrate-binding protein
VIRRYIEFCIGITFSVLALPWGWAVFAADKPLRVVAAENVYGDIARRIGGEAVAITNLINTPTQDPHLFEPAPSAARALADAQIVVFNGADYDRWMERLLSAAPRAGRIAINVAALRSIKSGDNPHLWYDPTTMPEVAKALAEAFIKVDLLHEADYQARLNTTLIALARINQHVATLKAKHAGAPVTATEAAFIPMANAIGLKMHHARFQQATANGTEPSARDIAALENDLKQHKVRVLIYNKQVGDRLSERLREIAFEAKVPVVGITETCPANQSFEEWIEGELDALDKGLSNLEPNS